MKEYRHQIIKKKKKKTCKTKAQHLQWLATEKGRQISKVEKTVKHVAVSFYKQITLHPSEIANESQFLEANIPKNGSDFSHCAYYFSTQTE